MSASRPNPILLLLGAVILLLAGLVSLLARTEGSGGWTLRSLSLPLALLLAFVLLVVMPVVVGSLKRYFLRRKQRSGADSMLSQADDVRLAAEAQSQRVGSVVDQIKDPAKAEQLKRDLARLDAERAQAVSSLDVVVFGTVSAGKTSLINALLGRQAGKTEAVMGTTQAGETHTYELKSVDAVVRLTDTPGMSEAGEPGLDREQEARALVMRADLLLFVIDHDLIRSEFTRLIELARLGKRSIVVLNKKDTFNDDELAAILEKVRGRLASVVARSDIVAVAAAPQPVPVRIHRPDGSIESTIEYEESEIDELRSRMTEILQGDSSLLRAANLLVHGKLLEQEARNQLAREREARMMGVIEQHQWITAATVFANPIPALNLVAGGVVQYEMISEIARAGGVTLSSSQARSLATQLAQAIIRLGLIETATSLVAGIFKRTVVGFAAGGAVQAVTMAYLTRIAGKALLEYFLNDQSWGPGGINNAVLRQFEQTSRTEFLQDFAVSAARRLLRMNPREESPNHGPVSSGHPHPPKS